MRNVQILNVLYIICAERFLNKMLKYTNKSWLDLMQWFFLWQIAARPGARHFRCLFRVMFVPLDAYDLLKEDPVAFEYFYMQVSAL